MLRKGAVKAIRNGPAYRPVAGNNDAITAPIYKTKFAFESDSDTPV
jgi:hypothetical protein